MDTAATVCQHRWQLPAEPESRDERVVRRGATIIEYRSTFVGTCKNCGAGRVRTATCPAESVMGDCRRRHPSTDIAMAHKLKGN